MFSLPGSAFREEPQTRTAGIPGIDNCGDGGEGLEGPTVGASERWTSLPINAETTNSMTLALNVCSHFAGGCEMPTSCGGPAGRADVPRASSDPSSDGRRSGARRLRPRDVERGLVRQGLTLCARVVLGASARIGQSVLVGVPRQPGPRASAASTLS
jgi:hypothetical protein